MEGRRGLRKWSMREFKKDATDQLTRITRASLVKPESYFLLGATESESGALRA
jgi:hypothetical protein